MAKIYIKCFKEPLEVERNLAKKIKDMKWGDKSMPSNTPISINDSFNGTLGDIKMIDLSATEANQSVNKKDYWKDSEKSYLKYREEQGKKTPFEKAQKLNIFNLMWQAFTGEITAPIEIQKQAIEIQTEFFGKEVNKKRIYCNPTLFKKILPEGKANGTMMFLIENLIKADLEYSKRK